MRMLVTMTFAALAIATYTYLFRNWGVMGQEGNVLICWHVGGTFLGAAIMTPYRRTIFGAGLGFGIPFGIFWLWFLFFFTI
jgi:hypothetical protein